MKISNNRYRENKRFVCSGEKRPAFIKISRMLTVVGAVLIILLTGSTIVKGTIFDLFSGTDFLLDSFNGKKIHFKVNEQDMDIIIGRHDDHGELLSRVRNNKSIPFYRDKNGGLAIHVKEGIDKVNVSSPGVLMSMIEPLIGFVNGNSTRYVGLRLGSKFDINKFLDTNAYNAQDIPVYPSAEKINTIQTEKFSIGHYKAQATVNAVICYYDSRLKSEGYKKLRETEGITLYQSENHTIIINVEERSNYVSIITYRVKNK